MLNGSIDFLLFPVGTMAVHPPCRFQACAEWKDFLIGLCRKSNKRFTIQGTYCANPLRSTSPSQRYQQMEEAVAKRTSGGDDGESGWLRRRKMNGKMAGENLQSVGEDLRL